MFNYFIFAFILLACLFIYNILPPKYLKDIPTVPLLPFIYSHIINEPDDIRVDNYISPVLNKHGIAKVI